MNEFKLEGCICEGGGYECCAEDCGPCGKDALAERDRRIEELRLACSALGKLVRAEYPEYSLAEIAETWGERITTDEIAALRALSPPTTEEDNK